FYYIPGTDICLKIGGYVRGEYFYNYGANGTNGAFQGGQVGASNPQANGAAFKDRTEGGDFIMRTRAYAWFDSRQQTEYGTLRSYLQIGVNYDSPNTSGSGFNAGLHPVRRVHDRHRAVVLRLLLGAGKLVLRPALERHG